MQMFIVLLTDAHLEESLVPALDHLTAADLEGEWLVTVQTVNERNSKSTFMSIGLSTHLPLSSYLFLFLS